MIQFSSTKRLIRLIAIALVVCLYACHSSSDKYEYYKTKFDANKKVFDSLVRYIDLKYITPNDRAGLNRKTILFCNGRNIFNNTDYRVCDSFLEANMAQYNISVISIEKNVCFSDRHFDLVMFELDQGKYRDETLYYYYSFCGSYNDPSESRMHKNIPLGKNWSLFAEK